MLKQAGADAVTFLGGATGIYCGYLDFIAWDIQAMLNAAVGIFEKSPLKWADFHAFRGDVGTIRLMDKTEELEENEDEKDEDEKDGDEEAEEVEEIEEECAGLVPEMYTEQEMNAVEKHIQTYFGEFENIWHELISPDIHVDICIIPPTKEKDYYTLVTMGMGAHEMNVPCLLYTSRCV